MPNTTILIDEQVEDIEALIRSNTGPRFGFTHELCQNADALCQTVRALRAERLEIQRILELTASEDPTEGDDPPYSSTEMVQGVRWLLQMKDAARERTTGLREQLAAVTQERDVYKLQIEAPFKEAIKGSLGFGVRAVSDFRTRAVQLCKDKAAEYQKRADAAAIGTFEDERFPLLHMRDAATELAQLLEQLK
jgi:hypothetical protein